MRFPAVRFELIALMIASLAVSGCEEDSDRPGISPEGAILSDDVHLVSYEALYELDLKTIRQASNVSSYRGLYSFSTVDACDGWTTAQKIIAEISTNEGESMLREYSSTSYESNDGNLFRFSSVDKADGAVVEEIRGDAVRTEATASGQVTFSKPSAIAMELPAGTLFPIAHTREAIRSARMGRMVYEAKLFDGSDEFVPFETSLVFGSPKISGPPEEEAGIGAELASKRFWPSQMGYYAQDQMEGIPEFEVTWDFFENGVATNLVLDYGDIVLQGSLTQLRMLEGGC